MQIETRLPGATLEGLKARGHETEPAFPWTMLVGGMHGIARNPQTGVLTGGCDPRRDGYVAAL